MLRISAAIGISIACFTRAVSGGDLPAFTLQPVSPQTDPASDYPPGTTIVGQEIILGSVPARVWIEVSVTGWGPLQPRALQAVVSATDRDFDGGGFAGAFAVCDGEPTFGADLVPAFHSCMEDADCRAPISGTNCPLAEPSQCSAHNFGYWPPGTWCDVAFQDRCHPNWIGKGTKHIAVVDQSTMDFRFAIALFPGEVMPDFEPSYLGTFVVDVPFGAKGSYTIDLIEDETFFVADDPLCDGGQCPPSAWQGVTITVPCGRCCSGYAGNVIECVDRVYVADCGDAVHQVFTVGEDCPESGGPACAECASNLDCNDGVACTSDQCGSSHSCESTPVHSICDDGQFCNGSEVCNMVSGCRPGGPPCSDGLCDEANNVCLSGIPTVSNWGLVILVLALLVTAKLRYSRRTA